MEPLYGFFRREAPEMFCGLRNFTGLSIGMPGDELTMTELSFFGYEPLYYRWLSSTVEGSKLNYPRRKFVLGTALQSFASHQKQKSISKTREIFDTMPDSSFK